MNITLYSQAIGFRNRMTQLLLAGFFLLYFSGSVFAENPSTNATDPVSASKSAAVAVEKPMTHEDSLAKAKADAIEGAELQRKETISTVLTVIGSVLAIVILLFLTWKLSSGGGTKSASPKASSHSHTDRALSRK